VCWTPRFQQSLASGNLKKLDLERLFSLRLPTAQRMYRFLDKRFYPPHQPPVVEMDLIDFACGHIGLSRVDNVAELKRRLAPAIAELEGIGFVAKAGAAERYQKVKPGVWRVRFQAGPQFLARSRPTPDCELPIAECGVKEEERVAASPSASSTPHSALRTPQSEEQELAAEFYRLWGAESPHVGERDLEQARALIQTHGANAARALLPDLVRVVKQSWPECKSFSGAAAKYGAEAVRVHAERVRAAERADEARARREQERAQTGRQVEEQRQREARWQALEPAERTRIEQRVLAAHPDLRERPGILKVLCLEEMGD
jgi:hypothetical protein